MVKPLQLTLPMQFSFLKKLSLTTLIVLSSVLQTARGDDRSTMLIQTPNGEPIAVSFSDDGDQVLRRLQNNDWSLIYNGEIKEVFVGSNTSVTSKNTPEARVVISKNVNTKLPYTLAFSTSNQFNLIPSNEFYPLQFPKPNGQVLGFNWVQRFDYQGSTFSIAEIITNSRTEVYIVKHGDWEYSKLFAQKIGLTDVKIDGHSLFVKGSLQSNNFDMKEILKNVQTGSGSRSVLLLADNREPRIKENDLIRASQAPTPRIGLAAARQGKKDSLDLLDSLKNDIFGQDYALERIAKNYSENIKNPTGLPKVLIAMGPSGAGKTYTASKLAERVNAGKMFEISGNEYSSHAGSLDYQKLLADSARSKDGTLVKFAKENPNGFTFVINEGEKMHPDIWKKLMEFIDTGVISDAKGEKVTVKNLWVFITSNRGASRMFPAGSHKWPQKVVDQRARQLTQPTLKGFFQSNDGIKDAFQLPPEIMNRVSELLVFGPTTLDAGLLLAQSAAKFMVESYRLDYGVHYKIDPLLINEIGTNVWSMAADARSIKRAINGFISDLFDNTLDGLNLKEGDIIEVKIETDDKRRQRYVARANGMEVSMAPSINPLESPLLDPEFRNRLKTMPESMRKIVKGQDEAIDQISDGVLSYFGRGERKLPFSAYLQGVSGNGKTELGRALAEVIYGDASKVKIIPMGNVSDVDGFETIFGSAAKFQGGDIERIFEKALRENPEGAVIVLDEISNMGGGDQAKKRALFMKLYDLFEEGRYVSPIDGTEYSLSKYQFILTGNDGENEYRGVTADDMLMEIWKESKRPERMRKGMLDAGIPAAFINRMNVIAHTKPLLSKEVEFVTRKLWQRNIEKFKEYYRGVEVEPSKNLLTQLSRSFFTPDQGGRGVRNILDNNIGSVLLKALVNSDADLRDLYGYKIEVDLIDSETQKPYRVRTTDRSVEFIAKIYKDNKLIYSEKSNVSDLAPKKIILSPKQALLTAFHEAGHIVANNELLSGERFEFGTIRGGSTGELNYYGYARYKSLDKESGANLTRERLIGRLTSLYAGQKSQEMAGFPKDAGWSQDLKVMRSLSSYYLKYTGLDPDFIALPLDKEGNVYLGVEKAALLEQKIAALLNEGERNAEAILKKNWRLVRAVAAQLVSKGEINRNKYLELESQFAGKSLTSTRHQWNKDAINYSDKVVKSKTSARPTEKMCRVFYGIKR